MKLILMWLSVITSIGVAALYSVDPRASVGAGDAAMRMVLFSGAVIGCGLFAGMLWRHPNRRYYIAPLSWMVNLALFYLVRIIGCPNDVVLLNSWSRIIHLHALILLIGGLLIDDHK